MQETSQGLLLLLWLAQFGLTLGAAIWATKQANDAARKDRWK